MTRSKVASVAALMNQEWAKQAEQVRGAVTQWTKRLRQVRRSAAKNLGLASTEQVEALRKDIARLSRRVDQSVSRT